MNDPKAPFVKPNPDASWLRAQARSLRRGYIERNMHTATGEERKRWNSQLNWREFWHGETHLKSFPRQIQVGTNWTCNLKCSFCRLTMDWTQEQLKALPPRELSISDKVEAVIEKLLPTAEMMVLTPLGEPLQWKGLKDLLELHKSLGSHNLALTTNGMLLNDRNAERIVRGELSRMFCSIDSNDPEVYRNMRVGGEISQVEEGIRRVNAWKEKLGVPWPELIVNATFMQRNIPQLPSMVRWAKDLGFTAISVQLMEIENPEHEPEFLGHFPQMTRHYVTEALQTGHEIGMKVEPHLAIRNLISASLEGHDVAHHDFKAASPIMPQDRKVAPNHETELSHAYPLLDELETSLDMRGKSLVEKCHYPWYNLLIDTDGDARPCCWTDMSFGNLNTQDFNDLWNGENAVKMRMDFLNDYIPCSCRNKHCRVDL